MGGKWRKRRNEGNLESFFAASIYCAMLCYAMLVSFSFLLNFRLCEETTA